jgi:hypothetical protein
VLTASTMVLASDTSSDFWWIQPGTYFTYLARSHGRLYVSIREGGEKIYYVSNMFIINYTIADIAEGKLLINLSITPVNAIVATIKDREERVIAREVNKTFSGIIKVDQSTLGVYHNNTWIGEWIYLATQSQIRGETPKLIGSLLKEYLFLQESRVGFFIESDDPDSVAIGNKFFELLRRDLGDEVFKEVIVYNERYGIYDVYAHGVLKLGVINQPPSPLQLTIRNYTISGDRIGKLIIKSPPDLNASYLELRENITYGNKSIYIYKVRTYRLYLYVFDVFGEKDYMFFFVDPVDRKLYHEFGTIFDFEAYYDYYTGILLRAELKTTSSLGPFIGIYRKFLGYEWLGGWDFHISSIDITLIDTNASFERPVIGHVEPGFNPIYIVPVGVAVVAIALVIRIYKARIRRSMV